MSKLDSYGRQVIAAAWAAISGIPATIAALANSSPSGDGTNVWVDSGDGAWSPISGFGDTVTGYMTSNVSVTTSYTALVSGLAVTPGGTYAAYFENTWLTSGVTDCTMKITSDQSGTITPINSGQSVFTNAGGAIQGNARNIAGDSSNAQVFSGNNQQVTMTGVFSVDDSTTSVTLQAKVNAGTLTAYAGGYLTLTTLVS